MLQNKSWYRYCTSNTLGYTWILTCRYWWQSLQVPLQRRGSYMTFTGWWVMQSCRPATGASSGAARVISNVSQHNGGLENNFGGTETFLTNHFMVINSKCFCGDRLTSVCLDISDVRVCASAVKRSISSTTGFHNHGEGPYLGPRHNYHKGRAAIRHYANQTTRPLWPLRRGPNFTLRDRGVNARLA